MLIQAKCCIKRARPPFKGKGWSKRAISPFKPCVMPLYILFVIWTIILDTMFVPLCILLLYSAISYFWISWDLRVHGSINCMGCIFFVLQELSIDRWRWDFCEQPIVGKSLSWIIWKKFFHFQCILFSVPLCLLQHFYKDIRILCHDPFHHCDIQHLLYWQECLALQSSCILKLGWCFGVYTILKFIFIINEIALTQHVDSLVIVLFNFFFYRYTLKILLLFHF